MTVNTMNTVKVSTASYANTSSTNSSSSISDTEKRNDNDSSEILIETTANNSNSDELVDADQKSRNEIKNNDIDLSLLSTVHVCAAQVRRYKYKNKNLFFSNPIILFLFFLLIKYLLIFQQQNIKGYTMKSFFLLVILHLDQKNF